MWDKKYQDEGTSIIALALRKLVKVSDNEYQYTGTSIIAVVLVNYNAGQKISRWKDFYNCPNLKSVGQSVWKWVS